MNTWTKGVAALGAPEGMAIPVVFPVLCLADEFTPDGRFITGDGLGARELPLPIMLLAKNAQGHLDSIPAGRIDTITFDGKKAFGSGWLLDDETGWYTAKLIRSGAMRGNSVDLQPLETAFMQDGEEMRIDFVRANIMGTTVVPFPAFEGAYAEIPESFQFPDGMMAEVEAPLMAEAGMSVDVAAFSADTPLASFHVRRPLAIPTPPSAMFEWPAFPQLTALEVDDADKNGWMAVRGHLASWKTCHLALQGMCITPPASRTNYAYFATGNVRTDRGQIPTGRLVLGGDHADERQKYLAAIRHYASTSHAWADVAVGEDEFGIWFAGAVRPETLGSAVYKARASALSGDWRKIGGTLELVAALSVNAPGFPVGRPHGFAVDGEQITLIGAGMVGDLAVNSPRLETPDSSFAQDVSFIANTLAEEKARKIVERVTGSA